ncbi:Protein CBG17466 [Caenorhabditis briggsae]|uniref:Protein CBG17466 n=1 Tax=Caenorhabditis briggsae TaxID=6238 RepID=A8XR48_CAEBR|nr:Protein CBG17466 [Caenorhabditis briggsae]CAP35121.2 Protein CBG17466 [Caenorhabditis briggsae]
MKLSKFPYLVQSEILDHMRHSDLFWLSFVSKNMKKLIKSSQITRFKYISHIVYDDPMLNKRLVYIPFKNIPENIMRIVEETKNGFKKKSETVHFQLNVSGKVIDFRVTKQYNLPEACFHPNDKESAIESIHNYFLDLFGDTVECQWIANYPDDFIPRLHNLSLCISVGHSYISIEEMEALETFFASSPVLKHIRLETYTSELFSPESKFYQAESIDLIQHSNTVPTFLRHFQGRQAVFRCSKCDILDLMEFLNRWRSGEGSRKLEYLKIILLSNDIALNEVLNVNGVKHIDATKTPPRHTFPKVLKPVFFRITDPITSHSYIVRDTDNRVASVSIREDTLRFGVWKETEEEFLRMVK